MIPGVSTVHVADLPWLSRGEQPTSWAALMGAARLADPALRSRRQFRAGHSHQFPRVDARGAPVRVGYATGGGGAFLTPRRRLRIHVARGGRTRARLVACAAAGRPRLGRLRRAAHRVSTSRPRPRRTRRRMLGSAAGRGSACTPAAAESRSSGISIDSRRSGAARRSDGRHDRADRRARQTSRWWRRSAEHLRRARASTRGGRAPRCRDCWRSSRRLTCWLPATRGRCTWRVRWVRRLSRCSDRPILGGTAHGRSRERIVRVDLPCSPCGQVRLPPTRCRGKVPDCMDAITVASVVEHAMSALARRRPHGRVAHRLMPTTSRRHAGGRRGRGPVPALARRAGRGEARGERWIKRCDWSTTTASRCGSGSGTAATRSGGSRRSTSTRCACANERSRPCSRSMPPSPSTRPSG